jgi:aminoglycoside phosphotransferase (APT) family kinase protein
VLTYAAADGGKVVGKVFARRTKAVRAWNALDAVHNSSRGRRLAVPTPLCHVEERDLLLMEHVAGTPLDQALSTAASPTGAREAIRAAARTLVELHDLPALVLPPLRPKLDEIHRLAPRLRYIVPRLVEGVQALLEELAPPSTTASAVVHGAYAPRQLLHTADGVTIVDVDSAALGDPAADVGYFMASLHEVAVATGRAHPRALASHFLHCYLAERPGDGLASRARVHQSIVLVRSALHRFCKPRQAAGDPSLLPYLLLEEAATCLRSA